jgi:catechol 2,3-dioxygenase-like lactoylglutathione lyase family enzyme
MSLSQAKLIGFIPTANAKAAREFYEKILGLTFESDDQFALVFRVGPSRTMLRIATTPQFTPVPYTIFGWEVDNIHATVADLTAKGVEFVRFDFLEQDKQGVWAAPGGASVAWFKDPDGNTLSVSQHPTS